MKYISIIALVVAGILTSTANAEIYPVQEFFEVFIKEEGMKEPIPTSTVEAIDKLLVKHKVQDSEVDGILTAISVLSPIRRVMTGEEAPSIMEAILSVRPENSEWVAIYALGTLVAPETEGIDVPDSMPAGVASLAILHAKARKAAGARKAESQETGVVFYQVSGERVFIKKGDSVYAVDPCKYTKLKQLLDVSEIKDVDKRFTKFKVSDETLSGGKGEFKGNLKVAIPMDWK